MVGILNSYTSTADGQYIDQEFSEEMSAIIQKGYFKRLTG